MQAFTTQRPARTLLQRSSQNRLCIRHHQIRHVCAASWQHTDGVEVSRRDLIGLAILAATLEQAAPAQAVGMSRYIKKKKLDPLDSYVPLVIEAQSQLQQLPALFGDPKAARQLLRTGAFNGLRDDVRALGEYAVSNAAAAADKETAGGLVPAAFKALEDLDNTLFIAQRDKQELDTQEASQKVETAKAALAALLATVPADTLAAAQVIVDKVNAKAAAAGSSGADGASSSEDTEALKQLLSSS